jgi:hypothetical protein
MADIRAFCDLLCDYILDEDDRYRCRFGITRPEARAQPIDGDCNLVTATYFGVMPSAMTNGMTFASPSPSSLRAACACQLASALSIFEVGGLI